MFDLKQISLLSCALVFVSCLTGCGKGSQINDFSAHFGGEIVNPLHPYVLFCKNDEVIDTIYLRDNNTFFATYDSLAPGLYSFRHDPEYQYVYFAKNDSIMVHVNTKDFDESVFFSGRGDQKNNFLMELYLHQEKDRGAMFSVYDNDISEFLSQIDAIHKKTVALYEKRRNEIGWDENFDRYARAAVDYHYYSKKELYPMLHEMRTGKDVYESLPEDFYAYRNKIDKNDTGLSHYAPYVSYLSHMINNMATIKYHNHFSEADLALKTNLNKLHIADTMISNSVVKNTLLNAIAYTYLLEDQNLDSNEKFIAEFNRFSTDKQKKSEIMQVSQTIRLLQPGKPLPEVRLLDTRAVPVNVESLAGTKTVIFCWTEKFDFHFMSAHEKAAAFKAKYPNVQFVSINFDEDPEKWLQILNRYKFENIVHLHAPSFGELRDKWALMRIHRTIVLKPDGTIDEGFANLFDANFERDMLADKNP